MVVGFGGSGACADASGRITRERSAFGGCCAIQAGRGNPEGVHVLVELKETADQETVGQVLKQSNGMKGKLGISTMRKAIVALRTSGKVVEACKAAGIELYLISAEKRA